MSFAHQYFNFWDEWQLYHKVTFDGENKLILVNWGVTDIDVKVDLYSDWKEWSQLRDNLKFEAALRSVGGDPTVGSSFLGTTFFLINGWRIRPWENNHIETYDGNLFVDGGGNIFVPTIRSWNIQTFVQRSNLVDYLVISSSSGASGSFTNSDRTTLTNIETTVNTISTELTKVSSSVSTIDSNTVEIKTAVVMTSGIITSGGINAVETTISSNNNIFDDMFVAVTSGSVGIVRKVADYSSTNGTFTFDVALPFTAVSGNGITVLPGYNPENGRIG